LDRKSKDEIDIFFFFLFIYFLSLRALESNYLKKYNSKFELSTVNLLELGMESESDGSDESQREKRRNEREK
jgi:hypothetical protein